MVGYVLSKFPALSTTFVLNELLELEAQGVPLHIFSIVKPGEGPRHEEVRLLKATVQYLPPLGGLLDRHRRLFRAAPRSYRRTLAFAAAQGGPTWLWRFLQAGYIAWEARRLQLSHLHAHFAHHPTTVALLASRLSELPFSFTAHAMDLFRNRVDHRRLALKLTEARFVATVSKFNLEFLRRIAPAAAGKLMLVPNGLDLEQFTPGRPPADPFRILSVARLVEKKGIAVLIDACAILRDRGLSFRCDIVGEGVLRSRLEARIRRRGLAERVTLVGPATHADVRERYRAAHLFVLPCIVAPNGDRDGLPVSLVEALASGLPVISTPVTGIPEVVRDEDNGLLVPSGNAAALAAAIGRVATDPALRDRLAGNARPSVAERFDRRRTIRSLTARFARPGG